MENICKRCKITSILTLVKGEMLCDHCGPMKGMINYHKKMVSLKNLKADKTIVAKTNPTKQPPKMSSGRTLTIKQPQVNYSSVERGKEVARLMKTVVKKSK